MSNLLSYKNYNGTVEYSSEDNCLFGKVIGLKSLLSYEGDSVQALEQDFHTVIDEYLADCKERNVQPEQPYKGSFNVRISPELHRNLAAYALGCGKSLNAAVEEAIRELLYLKQRQSYTNNIMSLKGLMARELPNYTVKSKDEAGPLSSIDPEKLKSEK
ncbi:MAG: type II toxin-antitoxin system HicB family antitoxin [Lachnospiraceae bacterium]|nr:type II toxin-antitoxin system HicB family antitoxin [Lachnospiraceae bacterium]